MRNISWGRNLLYQERNRKFTKHQRGPKMEVRCLFSRFAFQSMLYTRAWELPSQWSWWKGENWPRVDLMSHRESSIEVCNIWLDLLPQLLQIRSTNNAVQTRPVNANFGDKTPIFDHSYRKSFVAYFSFTLRDKSVVHTMLLVTCASM